MIERPNCLKSIQTALQRSRIVAIIGPRQVGKTTLARHLLEPDSLNYFDLEDPVSLARLVEPMTALKPLTGLVVIDEVQRTPELFPVLRVLADRGDTPAHFLLLGSASPALLRQASESLTGRIEVIEISGFGLGEVGEDETETLWQRGGFPLSFLAANEEDSRVWRKQFIQTFVERDLPQLGFNIPAQAMWRFWAMLAHYHGQVWNAAEPARSLGLSEATVRRYLDLLTGAFLVRQLAPWHENIGKRQVKAPKVFVRDTGLLHQLLGLADAAALLSHPKCGASWEGFVLEEVLRKTRPDAAYFWATHGGAELDMLLFKHGRRYGVEIKRADAPRLTPSMRHAMEDLRLDGLTVVYPGSKPYSLAELVRVIPLGMVAEGMLDG